MVIGFTGTRDGMTHEQRRMLAKYLTHVQDDTEFHHGDCVGADSEAHAIAKARGLSIVIHPSTLKRQRAYCLGAKAVFAVLPPLERNRVIVDACTHLVAAPAQYQEVRRSGTWATIRYARKRKRDVLVIWPDGSVAA